MNPANAFGFADYFLAGVILIAALFVFAIIMIFMKATGFSSGGSSSWFKPALGISALVLILIFRDWILSWFVTVPAGGYNFFAHPVVLVVGVVALVALLYFTVSNFDAISAGVGKTALVAGVIFGTGVGWLLVVKPFIETLLPGVDWRLTWLLVALTYLFVIVAILGILPESILPVKSGKLSAARTGLMIVTGVIFAIALWRDPQGSLFDPATGLPTAMMEPDGSRIYREISPYDCEFGPNDRPCFSPSTGKKLVRVTPEVAAKIGDIDIGDVIPFLGDDPGTSEKELFKKTHADGTKTSPYLTEVDQPIEIHVEARERFHVTIPVGNRGWCGGPTITYLGALGGTNIGVFQNQSDKSGGSWVSFVSDRSKC